MAIAKPFNGTRPIGRPPLPVPKYLLNDVTQVTLTNDLVRYRCERCGGLYDTEYQARNRRPASSTTNSAWHGCKARPKRKQKPEHPTIGG